MSMSEPSTPRKRPPNHLLVTLVVCAVVIIGLLLVIIAILASHGVQRTTVSPTPPPTSATTIPAAEDGGLDPTTVEVAIVSVLRRDYGIDDVSNVRCPVSMPVRRGASYSCALSVGGEGKHVTVHVTDDQGAYEVSRPS
ncbi:DUF4333 domain-containing protein [Nocardia terpenica]|uniref:DUF4333 domain-containing protein n=1 Tax=Nocardia terpenica TaxID=455432 RepID=A0A6G9YZH8_9NOCA|nr:DUF4333 domain-containing protein [Nocardia terpenica]QIS18521.1 DUF4333 domain-containing protein [Nocardia terpenica]